MRRRAPPAGAYTGALRMAHCPKCAQVVDRHGALCSLCEGQVLPSAPVPTTADATVPNGAEPQAEDSGQASAAPGHRIWSRGHTWAATATAAGAAVMAVTVIGMGGLGSRGVPAAVDE